MSTLSSMALQMSDVDATTQQEPAQNDGYEPYGTMEVVPTLYRPTSSVAPQECPTILQVLWHRRSAPQFYKFCGTAGVPHNSTSSVAPQERRHNSTSSVALRRSGVSKGDNGRRGHQGGPLRQKATDKDAETIIRSDEH